MAPPSERRRARRVYTLAAAQYGEDSSEAAAAWQVYMACVYKTPEGEVVEEEAEL